MRVPLVFWVSAELRDEVNTVFALHDSGKLAQKNRDANARQCDEFLESVLREAIAKRQAEEAALRG